MHRLRDGVVEDGQAQRPGLLPFVPGVAQTAWVGRGARDLDRMRRLQAAMGRHNQTSSAWTLRHVLHAVVATPEGGEAAASGYQ